MAKAQKKKGASTGRNPDRRNGKAWKKNKDKAPRVRTPERQLRDEAIRMHREEKRIRGMEAHQARLQAQKELEEQKLAEIKAEQERIVAERQSEIQRKKKPHKPKIRLRFATA